MKKTFMLMAAAVIFSLVACEKPDNGGNNNGGDEPEEPVFESPITVDGNFADWDALPAEHVTVITSVETPKEGMEGLKSAKVYADEMYINVLFEFNGETIKGEVDESHPVHIYLDIDNSTTTGGYGDEFSDACVDIMLENGIYDAGKFCSWDPALFKWWGDVNGSGWLWTDPDIEPSEANFWGAIMTNGSGIASGMGSGTKYELQIFREMTGFEFAETFGFGMDIQTSWTSVGILPNAAVVEGTNPNGLAPMAKVTIHRTVEE